MEKEEFKQLGEKLKQARERKNITLDEINEKTKINPNFLRNFENGEFDFLPQFYVRHFLKDYLNCIGRSAMHLLDEFEQLQAQVNEDEPIDEKIESSKI